MYSYGSPHMAAQKQGDQLERTFSSYVRIQGVVLKTYLGRWTMGRSGERGSGISVLPARYDDDDDDIYIKMHIQTYTQTYILPSHLEQENTPTASLQKDKTSCPTSVLDIWHETIWWGGYSNAGALRNVENPFIAIAPRSTQSEGGNTW